MGNIIQNCNDGGLEVSKRLASLTRRASANRSGRGRQPANMDMGHIFGNDYGNKIPYSLPFLMQVEVPPRLTLPEDGEEYINATLDTAGKFTCMTGPVVQSSIVTFHGPNGEEYNTTRRSSGKSANGDDAFGLDYENDLNIANAGAVRLYRYVQEGDIVTIFANIRGGGRYLALMNPKSSELSWQLGTREQTFACARFVVRKANISKEHNSFNNRPMIMRDSVTLESVIRPGLFLSATASNRSVHLSSFDMGTFQIRAPELRQLIKINGSTIPKIERKSFHRSLRSKSSKSGRWREPSRALEGTATPELEALYGRPLSKKEYEWMALMGKLPLDIVFLVMSFKGRWVTTARLVCRDWCRTAELHVRRIRVNGEFACISTQKQMLAMLAFIRRCQNVESVTLRNLDQLDDGDFEHFQGCNPRMQKLVVGGCNMLSDRSIGTIVQLRTLRHLNLAATNITDESLQIVSKELKSLQCLNLYGCRNITVKGVRDIAHMTNLESVNVRGTELDKWFTDSLQRQRPKLQVLTGERLQDGIY